MQVSFQYVRLDNALMSNINMLVKVYLAIFLSNISEMKL